MKKKIFFVLCLLFGLMMINGGLNKFFNYIPMSEDMSEEMSLVFISMARIGWILPLIAIVEIVAGILFIIPKTRALGAIMILPVMVGIVLTHVVNDPGHLPGVVIACVLFTINGWVILENGSKFKSLIG